MSSEVDRSREPQAALSILLNVYSQRKDLQEVYPEVRAGNYARLINWAAGVSATKWKDSSYAVLRPYEPWYLANFTAAPPAAPPLDWVSLRGRAATSPNCMAITLDVMRDDSSSDISYHLPTLSLLITEFRLKHILELGVRSGNSSLALLEAARQIGGQVTSVDVEPCYEARERVKQAGLDTIWKFIQTDDLELRNSYIPNPIDLLFVDTNHLYEHTQKELEKYSLFLKAGSWIALHDYVSFPGVSRSVHEFITSLASKPRFYPFLHQNGLALVRVNGPTENLGWLSLITRTFKRLLVLRERTFWSVR